jgi:hypothetical protein
MNNSYIHLFHAKRQTRNGDLYDQWREGVYAKYNRQCDICGSKQNLRAHHLDCYKDHPNLRTDVSNGVCMCNKHHRQFHNMYGQGGNTRQQYEDYKKRIKSGEIAL